LISCSHLHTIAAVKLAFKNDLNTFIIIRNPQDAVLSFLYTKINRNAGPLKSDRTTLLNELLQEWIEYYSFVYRHINKLTIIQFSEVIESPANISKKVACALNRDKTYLDKIDAKINEYSELMKRGENAKEKAYSSLPNEDRALFKDYNKQLYYECELKNEAISLYKNITS
jgi:hypothetical protein